MPPEFTPEFRQPTTTIETIFSERLNHWVEAFQDATPQQAMEFGSTAVRELDRLWNTLGLMDEKCSVSGIGLRSEIEPEIDDDGSHQLGLTTQSGEISGAIGTSRGFTVLVDPATGQPELWHMFSDDLEIDLSLTYSQTHTARMFVKSSTASVLPLRELEFADDYEAPLETEGEVIEALLTGVDSFDIFMNSATFRNMPNTEKGRLIDDLLSEIERTAQVRYAVLDFMAEKIVKITVNPEEGRTEYDVLPIPAVSLSGQAMGISMFHRELIPNLTEKQGMTRPRSTGYLGLMVELSNEMEPVGGLVPGSIVHIPLSGQNFGLQFVGLDD